jgi:hypothetical protein
MKKNLKKHEFRSAFSLAEVLMSLTIGAMILVAVLGIYSRADYSAGAISRRLQNYRLPSEVMQRIAEDLDSIISSGPDTQITIENGYEHSFPTARLTIRRTINDIKNIEQAFEEIVWQSSYDYESPIDGLVLYRSHRGMTLEDKLLNDSKEDWERELFVPVCSGVTLFKVNAIQGDKLLDKWNETLPTGIKVTLSFAEPVEKADGSMDVPDEEKTVRTIAIDRTRKIPFEITGAVPQEQKDQEKTKEPTDGNTTTDKNEKVPTGKNDRKLSGNNERRTPTNSGRRLPGSIIKRRQKSNVK